MATTINFVNAVLRLKLELSLQKDQQVASILGLTKSAFSERKTRNAFPEDKLRALATTRPDLNINFDYVLYGTPKGSDEMISNKRDMDAAILREHKVIGDVSRLSEKYGVGRTYILKLINDNRLTQEQSRATEIAQTVMRAGEVVYALPANHLQSAAGSQAIVNQLVNTIASVDSSMNVLVAICIIPVEEVDCSVTHAIEHPRATAAALQACAINTARKNEVA